eukprot:8497950-Karenia_brevis.AAC.1
MPLESATPLNKNDVNSVGDAPACPVSLLQSSLQQGQDMPLESNATDLYKNDVNSVGVAPACPVSLVQSPLQQGQDMPFESNATDLIKNDVNSVAPAPACPVYHIPGQQAFAAGMPSFTRPEALDASTAQRELGAENLSTDGY